MTGDTDQRLFIVFDAAAAAVEWEHGLMSVFRDDSNLQYRTRITLLLTYALACDSDFTPQPFRRAWWRHWKRAPAEPVALETHVRDVVTITCWLWRHEDGVSHWSWESAIDSFRLAHKALTGYSSLYSEHFMRYFYEGHLASCFVFGKQEAETALKVCFPRHAGNGKFPKDLTVVTWKSF